MFALLCPTTPQHSASAPAWRRGARDAQTEGVGGGNLSQVTERDGQLGETELIEMESGGVDPRRGENRIFIRISGKSGATVGSEGHRQSLPEGDLLTETQAARPGGEELNTGAGQADADRPPLTKMHGRQKVSTDSRRRRSWGDRMGASLAEVTRQSVTTATAGGRGTRWGATPTAHTRRAPISPDTNFLRLCNQRLCRAGGTD